jgi:ABC-2 type transport system permease protein
MIAERFVGTLLRFLPVLIIGLLLPSPYNLSLPYSIGNFIIFVISLVLACLLITSLSLIIHIVTMFTMESRGVITTYSTIAEVFMGTVIPIPFFPSWMIKISNCLPFRYIGDLPYRIYSNSITIPEGLNLLLGSFIWIIISIIIGIFVSKFALKKAVIQGG